MEIRQWSWFLSESDFIPWFFFSEAVVVLAQWLVVKLSLFQTCSLQLLLLSLLFLKSSWISKNRNVSTGVFLRLTEVISLWYLDASSCGPVGREGSVEGRGDESSSRLQRCLALPGCSQQVNSAQSGHALINLSAITQPPLSTACFPI